MIPAGFADDAQFQCFARIGQQQIRTDLAAVQFILELIQAPSHVVVECRTQRVVQLQCSETRQDRDPLRDRRLVVEFDTLELRPIA